MIRRRRERRKRERKKIILQLALAEFILLFSLCVHWLLLSSAQGFYPLKQICETMSFHFVPKPSLISIILRCIRSLFTRFASIFCSSFSSSFIYSICFTGEYIRCNLAVRTIRPDYRFSKGKQEKNWSNEHSKYK